LDATSAGWGCTVLVGIGRWRYGDGDGGRWEAAYRGEGGEVYGCVYCTNIHPMHTIHTDHYIHIPLQMPPLNGKKPVHPLPILALSSSLVVIHQIPHQIIDPIDPITTNMHADYSQCKVLMQLPKDQR
jgi:hypothetical protein